MGTRYTAKDVEVQLDALKRDAATLGVDSSEWIVQQGSQANGIAWRIFRRDPVTGGLHNLPVISDYLGWSAREAFETLVHIRRGIEFANYARESVAK